jgi:hypothetical protein
MVKLIFCNTVTLIIVNIPTRSNIMYHFSTLNYAQVPLVLPGSQKFKFLHTVDTDCGKFGNMTTGWPRRT